MLKPGNIIYVRITGKSGVCYEVATEKNRYKGILYGKDVSDKGQSGRTPPLDVFFRVMVSRQRTPKNEYIFEQLPVIWQDINPSAALIHNPKRLLCRVEVVKPEECTLIILDKSVSTGEYHIEGRLKKEHAQKALEVFNLSRKPPVNQEASLEDILWEGDLIYACCIEINHQQYHLEMSLDKWLEQREKMVIEKPVQEDLLKDSLVENWQDEFKEIKSRVNQIRKKIQCVAYLDNSVRACKIIENYGKTIGIYIETFTRSDQLLARLMVKPDLYQAGIFDHQLDRDDPGINGIETAKQVHKINPGIPIVVITAFKEISQAPMNAVSENIYGPYSRFGSIEMGLLNCLEIAAGIVEYQSPVEKINSKKTGNNKHKKVNKIIKRNNTLENKIAEAVKKNNALCRKANGIYVLGFAAGSYIPKCYYTRGRAVTHEQLKTLDAFPLLQLLSEQREYWLADTQEKGETQGMDALVKILGCAALFCLPLITNFSEKYLLIMTGIVPHFLNKLEREQARRFALYMAFAIQNHLDREPWMINFQTYSLGMIIEGLAHDLNHKMWELEGSLDDLKLSGNQEQQDKDALMVKLGLIEDILTETKTFTSQINKLQTNVNATQPLSEILENVTMNITPFAARKNTVLYLIKEDIPEVNIPGGELSIILFNLLHNAIRYGNPTRRATGYITITAVLKQNRFLQIRIVDMGIGIHTVLLEKIFERGYSAHGGSGLGLAICRGIVESIGGKLEVENSVLYGGTSFSVYLQV